MRNNTLVSLVLPAVLCACSAFAQEKTIQNLYFFRKNADTVSRDKGYVPGKQGFYIYRNCVYDFVLSNKKHISIWVTDISNDSIYGRPWKDPYDLLESKDSTDTMAFHPNQLKGIVLGGSSTMGILNKFRFRKYQYTFTPTASPKQFERKTETRYLADSAFAHEFELIPHIYDEGVYWSSHALDTGYARVADSLRIKNARKWKPAPPKTRNVAWFTPSRATEINGLNVGLQTIHVDFQTPIRINGVNLNADALSMFATIYGMFMLGSDNTLINMPDTVAKHGGESDINGLSISGGGLAGAGHVNGISINGGIHVSMYMNGLVITGTQNLIDSFNGVVIGGIRNKSIKGHGLQVGLFNICKHLKGVQIGVWNVNSKRKLPLINWSF